jgi:hypothetical protein
MSSDADADRIGLWGICTTPVRLTDIMNISFVASVRRFILPMIIGTMEPDNRS